MRRNVVIGPVGAASGTGAQRLRLSVAIVLLGMAWSCASDVPESPRSDFDVMEKSISELAEAMEWIRLLYEKSAFEFHRKVCQISNKKRHFLSARSGSGGTCTVSSRSRKRAPRLSRSA